MARLRVRHEPAARPAAGAADPGPRRRPRTRRSSSSPTASRPRTSRAARSSSAIRRRGARSARRCARSSAARRTGSRSTRSCWSGRRALAEFVAHMTRLNRGRAFYATPGAPRRVRARRFRRVAGPGGRPSRHRHLPGRGHDRGRWAGSAAGTEHDGHQPTRTQGSRRCSPPRRSPARRTTPATGRSPRTPSPSRGRRCSSWSPSWSGSRRSPPRPSSSRSSSSAASWPPPVRAPGPR